MLACQQVRKSFGTQMEDQNDVLQSVSYDFESGEKYVLLGPSGSGKTTLLSIVGCMLSPSSGEVRIAGQTVDFKDKAKLSQLRRTKIGFVFQHAQLLPFLNVEENLMVVCRNAGMTRKGSRHRTASVMERLGITNLRRNRPAQCSGGERQRVAIARAILHLPAIILADEPTSSLDWSNGLKAIELLTQVVEDEKSVLITVTHDTRLVPMFDHCLKMNEGRVSK